MHLIAIALALATACVWRYSWQAKRDRPWSQRWLATWQALVLPPLWLLSTALAILAMGWQGTMFRVAVSGWSYAIAVGFLAIALLLALTAGDRAWQTRHQLRHYPRYDAAGQRSRLIPSSLPFAAQIGFWSPELTVSQGLLDCLTPAQVEAVLIHERAHYYYRDTFWFFWWGWLRRLTTWLPRTEALWQELLLLRELRADAWAARYVEPLLLAEALLEVVRAPSLPARGGVAFADCSTPQRLTARIEALLNAGPGREPGPAQPAWLTWGLAIAPLLVVFWHH